MSKENDLGGALKEGQAGEEIALKLINQWPALLLESMRCDAWTLFHKGETLLNIAVTHNASIKVLTALVEKVPSLLIIPSESDRMPPIHAAIKNNYQEAALLFADKMLLADKKNVQLLINEIIILKEESEDTKEIIGILNKKIIDILNKDIEEKISVTPSHIESGTIEVVGDMDDNES